MPAANTVGAYHRDGALREIGGARGFVDQHDAERDEAVHRADKRSSQCELSEEFDIHGQGTSQIASVRLIVPVWPLS